MRVDVDFSVSKQHTMWDTLVLGSGISGLAAAAALAHCGQRVLVLEQHTVAGGQTQTFQRQGWTFATGVHYIGGVGAKEGAAGQFGRLLAQFLRHFPGLAPVVRFHELAKPLTQQNFVHAPQGAMYGLEMDAQRLGSRALNVRTPVPGLLMAGQDVSGAGVQASAMSGLMAALAIEPGLMRHLGG